MQRLIEELYQANRDHILRISFGGGAEEKAEILESARQFFDKQLAAGQNAQAALVRDDAEEALKAVFDFLLLFGSEECPHLFLHLFRPDGAVKHFWPALHQQWSGFDRIPHGDLAQQFKRHRQRWSADHMEEADRKTYDTLPERFEVYRGQDASAPVGLSWTLDRAVAEGFARGHRGIFNPTPVIITATVRKKRVAGVYLDREESEIVLFDSRYATNRKFESLANRVAEAA